MIGTRKHRWIASHRRQWTSLALFREQKVRASQRRFEWVISALNAEGYSSSVYIEDRTFGGTTRELPVYLEVREV